MERTFNTFIFDLDGTLMDTLSDLVILTNKALEEAGFQPHTADEIRTYVGNGARALMNQAVPQDAMPDQVEYALDRWKALYPEYGYTYTKPFDGVPQTLDALRAKGIKLGALSNKFDAAVVHVVDTYLPGRFDVVHGEGPGIPRKPDPTGLLHTIAELGGTPASCVYVGDSPGDMLVAHNADVFALGVSWGYRSVRDLCEAHADAIIDSPEQLLDFACC